MRLKNEGMMSDQKKIAVIGGGSWATAIVKILSENIETVGWYMRNRAAIEHIKKNNHNPNYLRAADVYASQLDLSSVPETGLIVGEHFHKEYGIPFDNIGVITGPCHAEEVAMERLSYLTIACQNEDNAKLMSSSLKSWYIKTKISDDIIGTEYAAMLKNIYAVAAGIAHGLGYGDNFQAVLMSNAIREMKRFIKKVHQMKRNINNSAYLGDLLVTGYSTFSRNRQFGSMVGKGYTVKSAQMEMSMIAEGYYATNSAFKMKEKNGANTPIINAVFNVLYNNKDAKKEFKKLTNKLD